jgi:RNA polymerase sigma factor (sigma-70 family)
VRLDPATEDLLRRLAPQVLGALVHRYGDFEACEDAVQEALLAAARQWPDRGVPEQPRGWLSSVAQRRLVDEIRADVARRRREQVVERLATPIHPDDEPTAGRSDDDTLTLLFLCCHPSLTEPSQVALTLRAVGGLTTAQIAAAFLVPEATMAQRISRAKQRLVQVGARFVPPPPQELAERRAAVLRVLYLVFNEGYSSTSGPDLTAPELTSEAIRLARELHRLRAGDGEVTGLLALMLLTEARRPARVGPGGALVPLDEQDRSRWDNALLAEGLALVPAALAAGPIGPYQVQAAIAAVHDEAESTATTDWAQILGLYALLEQLEPGPMVSLNRAVALAAVRGPDAGLRLLDSLASDPRLTTHHRLIAVRAHLLERAGDLAAAREAYLAAARRTTSTPERRYLETRAARLA